MLYASANKQGYRTCYPWVHELPTRQVIGWLAEWAPILESDDREFQSSL
jgi:hypothetical protein